MKLSKTMFLAGLTAASLFATGSAFGQDATTNAPAAGASTNAPPHSMRGRMDIGKMLNLTDDQKAQVQPILDAQREKMNAVRQDTSLSPDDMRAKMKQIRDDTSAQLKPILTPERTSQISIPKACHLVAKEWLSLNLSRSLFSNRSWSRA